MSGNFFMFDDEMFFYINMGTYATPSWVLVKQSEDVACDVGKTEVEIKGGIAGFKTYRGGDFDLPLNFMYALKNTTLTDTIYAKIYEDSFLGRQPIEFALTAGLIASTTNGFRAPFEVMKHNFKKEREGQQTRSISCRLTDMCDDSDELVVPEFFTPA